jgi:Large eukaryotic DNA virus major capsid protein
VYSFALKPEEHQPSGTCNFSRIDNATLQLVLSANAVGGTNTAKVRVYATNYNVLRIMSGMAGIASILITMYLLCCMGLLGAEKQPITNNQAMFVNNFGMIPVAMISC